MISIHLNVATALILAFGSGGGAQELAPLPASEARNLRKAFAEALAEPCGKGVRKLTCQAGKLEPRSFERTAELALEKADWSALYEAALELRAR